MKVSLITITTFGLLALLSCAQKGEKNANNKAIRIDTIEAVETLIDQEREKDLALQDSIKKAMTYKSNIQTQVQHTDQKISMKYINIPKAHITSDNRIRYEVDLGWHSNKTESTKRNDFFYKAGDGKTVIYDAWLEYGFMNGIYPCLDECNINLYAHTRQDIQPLENIKLVVDSQDVCGSVVRLIWVEHKKIEPEPLFITTMHGTQQTSFIDAATLKVEEWPEWINQDLLFVPQGSENKKVTLYKYGEDNNVFIAEVSSTGWIESVDDDKFGPSKDGKWQGIYYTDNDKCLIITPIDHMTQSFYGQDFSLVGFQDINGDGKLDIIIGNPVSLILESYKGGFRSWGFAFFPPGGC